MSRLVTSLVALAALFAAPASAQKLPLSASLYHRVEGDTVRAAVEIRIDPGWHIYHDTLGPKDAIGKPTSLALAAEGVEWGKVEFPEPYREAQPGLRDDGGDTWIWAHEGTVVLRAEGELDGASEPETVEAKLDGLVCESNGSCVPVNLALKSKGDGPDRLFPEAAAGDEEPAPADAAPQKVPAAEIVPQEKNPWAYAPSEKRAAEVKGRMWVRREGARLFAVLRLEVAKGWHLYHDELGSAGDVAIPTTVEMRGEGVQWKRAQFPPPEDFTDALGESAPVHTGSFDLRVVGELAPGAEPSGLGARVQGQACSNVCVQVDLALEAAGEGPDDAFAWTKDASAPAGTVEKPPAPPATGSRASGSSGEAVGAVTAPGPPEEKGLLGFILLAISGGLFALMMPCTYPMIPITISFFTKQASARGGKVLPLALAYGFGIVLIFVLIGVLVGPVIIAFATHPVTNLVIAVLFLVFAAALFGAINLQPPRFLMNAAGQATMHGGFFGVFLMGATLVVSSFTCTAPFVGSLLSVGATHDGGLGHVALGMGVFGLTMAVPFVALSLLPGRVQAMPRSGEWMNTLKVTLGFIEIAAALKFLSNADVSWHWQIFSRELFLLLWTAIFVLCAAYLFGWIKLQGHGTQEISAGRMTAAIAMLLFALFCWNGMQGGEMGKTMIALLPPYDRAEVEGGAGSSVAASPRASHTIVVDDFDKARSMADERGQLLLVNFTGYTCVNCRQMEKGIFPAPEVAPILAGMVEARLHTDGVLEPEVTEHIKELQQELTDSVANPIYLVMDPSTRRVLGRQFGASSAEEFARFLTESANRQKVAQR